jgi:hypothetical protein
MTPSAHQQPVNTYNRTYWSHIYYTVHQQAHKTSLDAVIYAHLGGLMLKKIVRSPLRPYVKWGRMNSEPLRAFVSDLCLTPLMIFKVKQLCH